MRYSYEIGPRARSVLLRQAGVITLQQARELGIGPGAVRRLVGRGHWTRVAEGILDANPLHAGMDKRIWIGLLHAGESAAVGGEAALLLHGLDRQPALIEVWVPPSQQFVNLPGVRVRRDFLDRTARAGGVPARIHPVDAIIDVGQRLSTASLIALLSNALRLRLVTAPELLDGLQQRQRVRERKQFIDVLGDLEGIESVLEYEYRRDVERAHGLPSGTRQVSVSRYSRSDLGYQEYGLLIEIDGRLGHQGADSAFRDLHRDNRHALSGHLTLRYGSADIRANPCAVARQVGAALTARGWPGTVRSCPKCARQAVS